MKKTNLLGALALASCVMLTGCKNKPEEEIPQEIEVLISGLPEVAIVGEEYDLDKFVTVKNSSASYTIELASESAEKAEVSGHKFTAKEEGEIKFTVKVGGKSAEGSIEGRTQIRQDLIDLGKGLGHEYTVIDRGQRDMILHGEGYVQTQYWDYDKTLQTSLPGGFLKFPGHDGVYGYTEVIADIVENVPEYEVEIANSVYLNDYMEYFNGDVSTDFSSLTGLVHGWDEDIVEEGEDPLEVLTLSGKAARDFAENSFFLPNGTYHFYVNPEDEESDETYAAPVTKLEFCTTDLSEEGEEPFVVIDVVAFAEVYEDATVEEPVKYEAPVNEYYITADPALVGDPLVEAAIADEANIPTGDGEGAKLSQFLSLGIPYYQTLIASYQYGWYVNAAGEEPGYFFDTTSEEFATFFAEEVEETIFEDAPCGSSMRLFSGDGILNIGPTYAPVDGVIQSHETVDEQDVITVYEFEKTEGEVPYGVYEAPEYVDIYASKSLSLKSVAEAIKGNAVSLDEIVVVGQTEEEEPQDINGFVFSINPYAGYDLLDAFLSSEDGLVSLLSLINKYSSRMDIRGIFSGSIVYVPDNGVLTVHLELPWDEAGLYSYCVDFSILVSNQLDGMAQNYIAQLLSLVPEEAE